MTDTVTMMSFSAAYLSQYMLAAVRVLGAVSLNPILGSARVLLGLFITFVIVPPGALPARPAGLGPAEVAGELLIGLLAGFTVALIFAAVQLAAGIINVDSGLGFGGTLDPSLNLGTGAIEQFVSVFALLVFVEIGGHHLFLIGLHELFATVPVGAVLSADYWGVGPGALPERLGGLVGAVFGSALKMALPVLAALVVADLGLALLARIAPQLNLFAVGFPLKIVVGLVALTLALPVLLPPLVQLFRSLPGAMQLLLG